MDANRLEAIYAIPCPDCKVESGPCISMAKRARGDTLLSKTSMQPHKSRVDVFLAPMRKARAERVIEPKITDKGVWCDKCKTRKEGFLFTPNQINRPYPNCRKCVNGEPSQDGKHRSKVAFLRLNYAIDRSWDRNRKAKDNVRQSEIERLKQMRAERLQRMA